MPDLSPVVPMTPTVLVGVDGSAGALDALALADVLAPLLGADVQPATVAVPSHRHLRASGDQRPGTAARAAPSVVRGLREAGRADDALLIVTGVSHRRGVDHASRRAGGERLIGTPGCALAFAPSGYAAREDRHLRVIGVGFDGGPESAEAARAAGALAQRVGGTLRIFAFASATAPAVASMSPATTALYAGASDKERLDHAAAELLETLPPEVRPLMQVLPGHAVRDLAARSGEVDLLVLGAHLRGRVERLVLGSVAPLVVQRSAAPALVFPPGSAVPFSRALLAPA